jgi:tripartite-type tricarboxylate transporter receptor subunit TctC
MTRLLPLTAILLAVAVSLAHAEGYPTKPVTIVVPTSPGGPPDTLARLLAEPMRASLGQPVVVENATGAGGTAGVARVVRAAPDGYTLSIGHFNSHVISSITYNAYDPLNDLEPVAALVTAPMVFVARQALAAKDMRGLVEWLKANPGKATFGSVGVGGPARVWGTHFHQATGVDFQFIPYRGAVLVVQDMLAGHIDLGCMEGSNVIAHLRGDKIRAHAVLADKRWSAAPDVPTIGETGVPGLQMPFWHCVWAPKGTPPAAIAKLNVAVESALADPAVRARLADLGQELLPHNMRTPAGLAAHHKAEIEKWTPIIKAAGIKAE